jgi:hypothetical protein
MQIFENTFISQNPSNARSLGISQFQSSNSLQNSTYSISMPKEQRFREIYKKDLTDTLYKLPDPRGNRSTTMGFGDRPDFIKIVNSPGPNVYKIESIFEHNKRKKGISIGSRINYKVKLFILNLFF